jgi:SAM-dependent methyltransferase/uncharacterized protein YbaR (Trm112 family)
MFTAELRAGGTGGDRKGFLDRHDRWAAGGSGGGRDYSQHLRRADPGTSRSGHAAGLPLCSDRRLEQLLRLRHFESLRPLCPVCRSAENAFRLSIAHVALESGGHIIQAILHCTNPACQREYPVIDGIPLIIPHIRKFIADNPLWILERKDLSPMIESLVGDCLGPGSDFDVVRQQVSAYACEHYGDLDHEETAPDPPTGKMLAVLETGLSLADSIPDGPLLDVGCGVGRGSFAVAGDRDDLVLGIDLHFPMLRVASGVLREGRVRYPRRRVGLVYDRRDYAAPLDRPENVDFWCCDAAALPFASGTFSLVSALNVLDSAYSPRQLLESIAAVLKEGGKVVLTCPYDWTSAATPLESWLGGHSQRSPSDGASEAAVRSLLTPGDPAAVPGLCIIAERDNLPWHLRLHSRSTMTYRLHLLIAERVGTTAP